MWDEQGLSSHATAYPGSGNVDDSFAAVKEDDRYDITIFESSWAKVLLVGYIAMANHVRVRRLSCDRVGASSPNFRASGNLPRLTISS